MVILLIKMICYILIIPGFGIISTTISASSNKFVFGYLGMVKNRPTLANNYVNFLYMLETSKTLNTSNKNIYSKKVKDITMSNQQVVKYNVFILSKFKTMYFNILRDYTRKIISNKWLRYSPLFYNMNFINMKFIDVYKMLKRNFSICYFENKINPNWISGFVDAEGCFSVIIEILEHSKWKVRVSFEINLHKKDKEILYKVQSFFGIGNVYHRPDKKISAYRVTNIDYINNIIIPHFLKYSLFSKKRADFLLWVEVIKIISNKEHLTEKGFLKILSYYASINRGISKKVLNYYPKIIPANKPTISLPENLNPNWVSGFVAGDGGFSIYVRPTKDYIFSEKVYCRFHIAQHSKDLKLMYLFIKFFGCGTVNLRSNISTPRCDFIVQDFDSLLNKVIRHFDSYPLLNLKQKDFICFKDCIELIKSKNHLTREGLDKIKSLSLEMNSNRLN